jgi:hypothetical protein
MYRPAFVHFAYPQSGNQSYPVNSRRAAKHLLPNKPGLAEAYNSRAAAVVRLAKSGCFRDNFCFLKADSHLYIYICNHTHPMHANKHLLLLLIFWSATLTAQPSIQWQRTFGGTDFDQGNCIIQTKDGGYVLAAETRSKNGDGTC